MIAPEPYRLEWVSTRVLYLPTYVDGRLMRGALVLSQVDRVVERFPRLKELFVIVERRAWAGMNVSEPADVKLVEDLSTLEATRKRFPASMLLPIGPADFVDHEVFRPLGHDCRYDVIQIASWSQFKRLDLFIRAAAELPRLRFLHIGHFPYGGTRQEKRYRKSCLRLARSVAPNIEFPFGEANSNDGLPQDAHEINLWLNRARLGVLTTSVEGINRFKMECLAADRPVLVAEDAAHPTKKHINDSTGALFEPQPLTLAAAISAALVRIHAFSPRSYLLSVSGNARASELLKDGLKHAHQKYHEDSVDPRFAWDGRNQSLLWGAEALGVIERMVSTYS